MKTSSPDLKRPVYMLLGLPIDAYSMQGAVRKIEQTIASDGSCVFSTPNLNFIAETSRDPLFRSHVLNCDMNLADGKPLIWLSKLLGLPIAEKVSGSDLFDALQDSKGEKIKIFFFGGPEGSAEIAAQKINAANKRFECVGYYYPGFRSVDEMSAPEVIDQINACKPHFLIVSLGAKKGHAWIERNKAQLQVNVVSHLGAVVNFVAGNVKRAPVFMQRAGLEWAYRIYQEPRLWVRYFNDLLTVLRILVTHVLPGVVRFRGINGAQLSAPILHTTALDKKSADKPKIDLEPVLSSAALAQAALVWNYGQNGHGPVVRFTDNARVQAYIKHCNAEYLLTAKAPN